ncbi:MAG: SLBB domain-containing protein, partial [Phycisphaerales bacterium]
MPTQDQVAAFERAASVESRLDVDRIRKAKLHTGPYRVVPGDVLEFTMPGLLRAVTAAEAQTAQSQNRQDAPYICRVGNAGTITLPAVGELGPVAGLSLADIEEKVAEAYRQYVVLKPSIFVRVLEYKTSKVYIAGEVEKPGVYSLRADQMTLVSLLTEAGGISKTGAAVVRVIRSDAPAPTAQASPRNETDAGRKGEPTILLPVAGMNVPFCDAGLEEGDTVVVEQTQTPLFTVVGLVGKPGNFEYPPAARYNLMQAIAFAGGLDLVSDPRYATIYRLAPDGAMVRIPFRLVEKDEFTEALNTPIRPGDVVAIEHTPRTRMNTMIRNLVHFNTGL